jgi:hypothetical protein
MHQNDNHADHPSWNCEQGWQVALSSILAGPYGRKAGSYLYTILFCAIPIYVGKTTTGVRQRLLHHMGYGGTDLDNLGRVLRSARDQGYHGWSVEGVRVRGDLDAAEQLRIRQLRPPLNKEFTRHTQEQVEIFVKELCRSVRSRGKRRRGR